MTPYDYQTLDLLEQVVKKPARTEYIGTMLLTAAVQLEKINGYIPNPEALLRALAKHERANCYVHNMGLPKWQSCNRVEAIEFIRFCYLSLKNDLEERQKASYSHFNGFKGTVAS